MRHLENTDLSLPTPKQEYLPNLIQIKHEMFENCDNFIKTEFISGHTGSNLNDSDSSEDCDALFTKTRRNRRKALLPQRAIQSEACQSNSLGNSSESSQDHTENPSFENNGPVLNTLLIDSENTTEMQDELLQDINEENIFKDLQEEARKLHSFLKIIIV